MSEPARTKDRWKEALASRVPSALAEEIDAFETQIELRRQGKMDEKVFAETRLRRGVYGQRYDHGKRNDGVREQTLAYPAGPSTKGPNTLWDAPGMQRIKIPFGGFSPDQMLVLAEVAEEYGDGILHVTTRQDFQVHFVHIEDTPNLMRRLAASGITTREACGNTVRNVTACPLAGICREEVFDVTPYARACAAFLLGHPDAQDFGRKFKVAFSGCKQNPCGLTFMHDLGLIAAVRQEGGREVRGFEMYVGGGLGSVPYQAKLFDAFMPMEELFPMAQAIARVFARLGEKKNRGRARIKFLVAQLGLEEFRRLVLEERKILPADPRWTSWVDKARSWEEKPLKPAKAGGGDSGLPGYAAWAKANAYTQRQEGYTAVTVNLPLGDLSSDQMRGLARIARTYSGDSVRATVDQNILLRWVPQADLPGLHRDLSGIGLAQPYAGTIVDITACPGTDTCKLGIASSRGLAGELHRRLAAQALNMDESVRELSIKISGCFNSCGQHHIADLGFYGVSRNMGGYTVPHFQVILGGQRQNNASSYGLAVAAVPSKRIPDLVERLTGRYLKERAKGESFRAWVQRVGKKAVRALIEDLLPVPSHDQDRSYYTDWGDSREYSIADMGVGECAGEVVSLVEFGLSSAERLAFEAQVKSDEGDALGSARGAHGAMVEAARALVKTQFQDVPADPESVVKEFRARFYDSQIFFDPFAGGKFAQYFFRVHEQPMDKPDSEEARRRVEEAQLFIEACYACYGKMQKTGAN